MPTADEVGFYKPWVSRFFARGGSVPTVRGDGVYQQAMDFCCDVLDRGGRDEGTKAKGWVHIFPEGLILLLVIFPFLYSTPLVSSVVP